MADYNLRHFFDRVEVAGDNILYMNQMVYLFPENTKKKCVHNAVKRCQEAGLLTAYKRSGKLRHNGLKAQPIICFPTLPSTIAPAPDVTETISAGPGGKVVYRVYAKSMVDNKKVCFIYSDL